MNLKHNGIISIATGRSRKELNWKNKDWQWSDLLQKLGTTHRTAETYAEYLSSKKPRQDEIKDVGGFFGGFLAGGKRRNGSVLNRQLITLDIDFAKAGLWDDFTMLYDQAACVYSTHKHCADSPRLRLIMPLDRPVATDEYEAIARRIAGNLDIEVFDHTTFQAERLMYWPSTAKDGEYVFEYQDGPWISADEVLASYHDWKDSSEWPVSVKVDKIVQRDIAKQGDPLEKTGIIGAFCRSYSIHEAIDAFLQDVYEPCAIDGRYTYSGGSTAAGLITYDDKFAYSHHGTDPASGKLCNAFDLVRIHKYSLKDEDAKEGTPPSKLPSFSAMTEMALKDAKVKQQFGEDQLSSALADFGSVELRKEDTEWLRTLEYDKKGVPLSTIDNIVKILENDVHLNNNIAYDAFEQRAVFKRKLPWRKVTHKDRYITDRDDDNIEHYIESVYGLSTSKLDKAMSVLYERHKFHPVRDYLQSLYWDGTPRVDSLFIDYIGAEDNPYTRAVTRKTLVAAVARVMQPGCKFDYMLVFVGKQGIGKSSLIGKLGKEWYSDSFATVQGKEAYEQIQGVWLVEMAELSGLRKADIETTKHFVSKREDRFRVAYGKRVENFPRQCIFFGSTNKTDFLRDPTGNRRFWPISIEQPKQNVFSGLTEEVVDQVWAEAVQLYKDGEELYLSKDMEELAFKVQERHSERDDRAGIIERYLDKLLPVSWEEKNIFEKREYLRGDDSIQEKGTIRRNRVCAAEIWCEAFELKQGDMNAHSIRFIHDILRGIDGWTEFKNKQRFGQYGIQRGYYRDGSFFEVTDKSVAEEEDLL